MSEPLDFETWRRNRGSYIGGSDVAAIMGLSPYRNIGEVWIEKVRAQEKLELGDETIDPEMQTRFTRWGKRLEPVIIAEYADVTGYAVNVPGLHLVRHPEFPFIGGTIDAEATTEFGDQIIVEAKSTDAFYQAREKVWGEAETDEVPQWFVPQGMQYLIVRRLETRCDYAVLVGGNDFRRYPVPFDRELAEQMIELQIWFWGLVTRREAPPMDFAAKNATTLQRRIYDKIVGETLVIADPAQQRRALTLIAARDQAHLRAEHWTKAKDAATAEILNLAGNHGRVEIPVDVAGKKKIFAINRKPRAGYEVAAFSVDPTIALSFEPYHLKKREDLLNGVKEENPEWFIEEGKQVAAESEGPARIS